MEGSQSEREEEHATVAPAEDEVQDEVHQDASPSAGSQAEEAQQDASSPSAGSQSGAPEEPETAKYVQVAILARISMQDPCDYTH